MSVLVKQAGIISAADFLRLFVKTIIGIVLARLLTQAEYGTYRQLYMIYMLMAAIFMLGLPQSIFYFLPKSDDMTKLRFIKQTVNLFMMLGLISSLLLLVFRFELSLLFNNPELHKILILYALYPFFMFLSQLFYSVMIGLQRPKSAAKFILFSVISDFILILGTAIITKNLTYITIGLVAAVFLQWIYAYMCLSGLKIKTELFIFDRELLKKQLKFSFPIGIAAILGVVSFQIDKLVISSHFSPAVFAVFAVGATELPFLGIIINSVNAVILPEMSKSNNRTAICDLYKGAVRKNALLIFPIFAFCMVFASQIIQILYSEKYLEAARFFRIYLLTMPLRVATYGLMFQVYNKTRYIFLISILTLILNLAMSIVLINLLGAIGPAISAATVTFTIVVVYLFLIRGKLGIELLSLFPLSALVRTMSAAAVSAGVCYWILNLSLSYHYKFLIGLCVFLIVYYISGSLLKAILPCDKKLVLDTLKGVWLKARTVIHA